MAESSFRLARSPAITVSTLWPSRRRAMSSISQMERSSSQTRTLPMVVSTLRYSSGKAGRHRNGLARMDRLAIAAASRCQTPQPDHELAPLSWFRPHPYVPFVRLHDLVHDG